VLHHQEGIDFDDLWDLHVGLGRIRAAVDDLKATIAAERKEFNPAQPRDEAGRWASAGAIGIAPDGTLIDAIAECVGISGHALRRMQERGISAEAIREALENPTHIIPQLNGNTLYIGPRASVVLSPMGWMVTCM
jgi:Domain of unknown function (DUF4258)